MSDSANKRFMVHFCIPQSAMADWAKTDPKTREEAEKKMMQDWENWDKAHAEMIECLEVVGKTKEVKSAGVADTRNDIMMYAVAKGESHEAVAMAYQDHPHLQIPPASIEIMEITSTVV